MSGTGSKTPISIVAADVAASTQWTGYPEPFATRVAGRDRRSLGDVFGLTHFGVNLMRLPPGGVSALRHAHSDEDEFIYILEGTATLLTDDGDAILGPGHCAGFRAGGGSHQVVNRTLEELVFLEVGDRSPADVVTYPGEDILSVPTSDGGFRYVHRDGTPY